MLKKTCALAGLALATAGGVLLTGSPASAQGTLAQWHHHRHHYGHYSSHRNVNINRNRNHNRVVVRVNVRNRNNNIAFAGRERERFHENDFGLFRRCHFGCGNRFGRFGDDEFRGGGFGRDRDDDDRGDTIIVGNDFRALGDRG